MGIVQVDQLTEGLVLADDVRDVTSRLLLSKGQKVAARHMRIFKIWGVTEVRVDGDRGVAVFDQADAAPEAVESVTRTMDRVFAHVDRGHPAINELFRLSVEYRSRQPVSVPILFARPRAGRAWEERPPVKVKDRIDRAEIKLPEIPSIIFELNEIISAPFASAQDIARIVSKSPSIAALLLRIVNSSFYGFPGKIDSITHAVTLIGSKEISSLALGISTMQVFKDIPGSVIDMRAFVTHSLACGILSRVMAAQKNIQQTEQMFVSGLLHDIGRLIAYKYFPDESGMALHRAGERRRPLFQAERDVFGWRHPRIGKHLLEKWKLPLTLENTVFHHHHPSRAKDPIKAAIVQLADMMAIGLGLGSSGERLIPCFDEAAWELLGIPHHCFKGIIQRALHQLAPLETHFGV